ncbi:hypothetical protein [Streptomyces sp. CS113]|uniref:hypothetical protein n=1 Tax=Streptomyces sp. CS113 TaxID=1982761 RepID=UPI00117FD304|nr:hypothetical protein [Streptomyces sp. CS113]
MLGSSNGFKEFWSDAWETLSDPNFWKAVGDMLAYLAMVIGVPSLGLIGLVIAGGALLAHTGAMLGGADGVTWQTLARPMRGRVRPCAWARGLRRHRARPAGTSSSRARGRT